MNRLSTHFFFVAFLLLFSSISAFSQDIPEKYFPKSYENPQKIKFYDKADNYVRFWFGLEEISDNLYERAFLAAVLETKAEFRGVISGKNHFNLLLLSYEAESVTETKVIEWVKEAQAYLSEIKNKSVPSEYIGNLKNEVQLLRR
jgi:hypothetical protein